MSNVVRIGWVTAVAILTLIANFTPKFAMAQDVEVQALVNETTVGDQERVTFTLEIKNATFADVESPEVPMTEGLALISQVPSTQRNMSFINGRISQSVAYQWSFRPLRTGTATIQPVTLTVKGEVYRTETIQVEVVPQAQRPAQPSRRTTPFGGTLRTPDPAEDGESRSNVGEQDMFIRAIPSTRRAFQNEQINIEYQLYFRPHIQPRHSRLADSWDAEGFWREELDVEARPMPRPVVENGIRYNTIVLKRVAVFPTRSGRLTIDPLRIETEIFAPASSNDPFGRFFSLNNPYEAIERASPPITIEARPLPPNAPTSFRGAVGQFDLVSRINKTEVEVGEAVEVRVRISGTGNLAVLEPPPLSAPGIFEAYDPDVETTLNNTGRQVRGIKTFTYLLVPRSNGTFELPALEFSYFDPASEQYRTLRSSPTTIRVTGSAAAPVASSTVHTGLPVDDITPLLTEPIWHDVAQTPLHRRAWPYLALALPLLALLGLIGYRRYTHRLATDVAYARHRRAHPVARRHLKRAEVLLKKDEPRPFYEELERAVLGFVGNRLNVAELGLTRPQLDARLAEAGVPASVRTELQRLLEACDRARFAPERPSPASMEAALDAAHHLIATLDDAFSHQATMSA